MDDLKGLVELGRHVASEQDAALAQHDLGAVRQRVLQEALALPHPQKRSRAGAAYALAGAVVAAAALTFLILHLDRGAEPDHLEFRVDGQVVEQDALDNWWSAPSDRPLPIQFSDGTTVALEPKSRARVLEVGQSGAHIVLESGASSIHVVPRESARWQVSAGPFLVQVVGTRFDLEWGADDDVFVLRLHEGKVNLSGCLFGKGRSVVAGETVRASCKTRQYEIATRKTSAAASEPSAAPPGTAVAAPKADNRALDEKQTAHEAPSQRAPSWKQLAHAGKYKQALEAANDTGFEAVLGDASASDLALLGDAARYSAKPGQAIAAYEMLRTRFPGTSRAATAAYSLARTHFDQRGAYGEAARWFQQYLQEQPSGPLAREARGRLMESLERSGDRAGARRVAEAYLKRYPGGPHATVAKSLTEKTR
ncbi:MAG TPA: FecR domain-containing protein [Polyangiaceae bacterium]|nr:FecR domain-containing protein [Polyangiaceae bacterium]